MHIRQNAVSIKVASRTRRARKPRGSLGGAEGINGDFASPLHGHFSREVRFALKPWTKSRARTARGCRAPREIAARSQKN
jgi:hypothetical protein